jgi:hypothetical protein
MTKGTLFTAVAIYMLSMVVLPFVLHDRSSVMTAWAFASVLFTAYFIMSWVGRTGSKPSQHGET